MYKKLHRHTRNISTIIIVLLFSTSLWQLATASWIQGKAIIAQQLLNNAWKQTLADPDKTTTFINHKPWPWADTWPVAKLIVPQYGIEQIVLAGDSGSSLAFAPGYSLSSAFPNTAGLTVISAHRDTHFQFLHQVKINDEICLQTADKTMRYKVYDLQVIDSKTHSVQSDSNDKTLALVTCYPFNAIASGGSLRYVIFAHEHPL